MNKEIKLFEAFAGIGSQFKALKEISNLKKWIIRPVGIIEWYIDAIIAYMEIHYSKETKNFKMNSFFNLTSLSLSSDSKHPISNKYLENLNNSHTHTH
ncbi:DNA (cytosine-5-)-methyltransferase N-terminal subunit [Mycoplasmoides pirum]|uniref:DNA (cytosine-5-)-methyltransferase N-terminal subunit n=1 Tax=Mycoplasmoides pirum TaxID=2122 RepID=UPI0006960A64|nr:hypothetical protein [Mycoplasmoides pirum]